MYKLYTNLLAFAHSLYMLHIMVVRYVMQQVDVVIAGSGPAGVLLAMECGRLGLSVICVSPTLGDDWDRCFGIWASELPDEWKDCVETSWAAPTVRTWSRGERLLAHRYMKLDTPKLQANIMSRARSVGVQFIDGLATDVEHQVDHSTLRVGEELTVSGKFFVDATGGSRTLLPAGPARPIAYQTAYGEHLEVESHPFEMGEMVFMDLRSLGPTRAGASPSFLYAMPLSKTEIFVEETTLISEPEMSLRDLQSRLHRRLKVWNIVPKRRLGIERCRIPMTFPLPDRNQRTLAFGAAASMVHPATGYLLARTMRKAPGVAAAIHRELQQFESAEESTKRVWREIWPKDDVRKWELYTFGANFLAKLDDDQVERFFDVFFDLPAEDWHGFMTGELSAGRVATMMTKVFLAIDSSLRWRLVLESVGASSAPLLRAAAAQ